jgi:hypothetical protein
VAGTSAKEGGSAYPAVTKFCVGPLRDVCDPLRAIIGYDTGTVEISRSKWFVRRFIASVSRHSTAFACESEAL